MIVTIDSTGASAPTYQEILEELTDSYKTIHGSDAILDPDSADGQQLAIFALAVHDANQSILSAYNSRSPQFAFGEGLSSVVKLNGIKRRSATRSTATCEIIGQAGSVILNGVAKDILGNKWDLPASVTIPSGGMVSVLVTAQKDGDIQAPIGTINGIATPQLGWQSISNTLAAIAGDPVESDAELRSRQTLSVSLPATSPIDAIRASIANVSGVVRSYVFENPTGTVDFDGIPAHSIAAVVSGGAFQDIANAIGVKKSEGTGTYGNISATYIDASGIGKTIKFFALDEISINVEVTIQSFPEYLASTGDSIKQSVVDYINTSSIGEDVYYARLYTPANAHGESYVVTQIKLSTGVDPVAVQNIAVLFNQAAVCSLANVTLVVL